MPGVASRMRRPVILFNGFTRFGTTGNSLLDPGADGRLRQVQAA